MSDKMTRLLTESMARVDERRANLTDAPCPNCGHREDEHCSRGPRDDGQPCCPGYCFVDSECDCPGFHATAAEIEEHKKARSA